LLVEYVTDGYMRAMLVGDKILINVGRLWKESNTFNEFVEKTAKGFLHEFLHSFIFNDSEGFSHDETELYAHVATEVLQEGEAIYDSYRKIMTWVYRRKIELPVKVEDLREIIEGVLKKHYPDLETFEITYSILDETEGAWRVNIRFRKEGEMYDKVANFKVDAETGDVTWFKEGFTWTFP